MAISKTIWNKARALFELGKPLTYIADELNIDKGGISRKAKKECWQKSINQQLKDDIIDLEHQNSTIQQKKSTLSQQVVKLQDFEISVLESVVLEESNLKSLIFNATALNILRANEHLTINKKLEKINVGDGIQNFEEVGLGSSDYKNIQDTLDKASITLNVNQRHAASQVQVNQQQNNNMNLEEEIIITVK